MADSGSSPLKSKSKYSDPSLRGEEYLDLDLDELVKNCMRSPCTKFSEAELAMRGKLGARALSAVLFKSWSRNPHLSVVLNVSTPYINY